MNSNELPKDLEITFVAGPPRSGTTLLAGMISGGEAYPMLPECSIITSAVAAYKNTRIYTDPVRRAAYIGTDKFLRSLYADFVSRLIANAVSQFEPRRFLVLKDPELSHVIDEVAGLLNNPIRVVCAVRDPRDVVASLVNVRRRAKQPYSIREITETTFRFFCSIDAAKASGAPLLIVRYEDLAIGNPATFDELDTFIGYQSSREGFRDVAYSFEQQSPFHSVHYGKAATAKRIGAARETLSPAEIRIVEQSFAGIIEHYNYPKPHGILRLSHQAKSIARKAARRLIQAR